MLWSNMDLLENISDNVPKGVALMGLDVGKKTIGVAISDSAHSIAFSITTVNRKKFSKDIKELEKIIREYNIGGYVIGYPLHMDGREGRSCQSIRDFGLEFIAQLSGDLKGGGDMWVALWDERLSTSHVEGIVGDVVGISKRKAKAKGIVDKLAAQVILQGALDYMERN